jgi:hypothetical protein
MPVGNVLEQAFDEIWNGPAFIETRKKILNDRQDLLHCSRCLINYKHRDRGMFHSSVDFRELKTGPVWEAERRNEHAHGRRFAEAAGVIGAVYKLLKPFRQFVGNREIHPGEDL